MNKREFIGNTKDSCSLENFAATISEMDIKSFLHFSSISY